MRAAVFKRMMGGYVWTLVAIFGVLLSMPRPALAEPSKVFVATDEGRYSLNAYIEYLDDIDGVYSFEHVQQQANQFRPLTAAKKLGYDYKGKALWVRVAIDTQNYKEPRWLFVYDYEHVGNLQVYYPTHTGYQRVEMDQHLPQEGRQMQTRRYVVTMPTVQSSSAVYYVRLQPEARFLRVSLMWSGMKGLAEDLQTSELLNGAFFGALMIMLIYNAMLWRLLRDHAYGYYVYYLACFIATFLHIYGFTALFMRLTPFWEQFFAATGYGAIHGLILFTRRFLSLAQYSKWIDRYLSFFQVAIVVGGLAAFFQPVGTPYKYLNFFILLVMPATVIAGILRLRQGFTPARSYTLAWIIFAACLAVLAARSLNFLPLNFFTDYAVRLASVLEATLLSIALGQRIKLSDAEALRLAKDSERILLAEQKAVDQAKSASEDKNMFLSMVTHELRSSLQPIVSSLAGLESRVHDVKLAEYVQRIKRSSNSLTGHLRDLLTLSRGEAGRIEIFPRPFEANALVSEIAERARDSAQAKGLQLHVVVPSDHVLVVADDRRIEQVVGNLVSNAIKYTAHGHVRLTLEAFDARNGLLRFVIQDTGPGISAQQITNLFTPFRRFVSMDRDTDGSGIGLAVVDTVVRCLAGSIDVKSANGQGTTFYVTIPAVELRDEEQPASVSSVPIKVLIVDDQNDILTSLAHELSDLGCAPDTANSAAAGANLLATKTYDLVLIDLNMPGKNGRELALETRDQDGLNAKSRMVAISAVESGNGGELWPFDEFLAKPMTRQDLTRLLASPMPFSGAAP